MRNCLVLGSGRSGTSMVAGALARAGYHLGESLHAARAANPKGFFEAAEINDLNDAMVASMLPPGSDLGPGQHWIAAPPAGTRPKVTRDQAGFVRRAAARVPFCYKDPRFSFTLPAWREAIEAAPGGTGLVCVFRHPAATAVSMVEEVASAPYLAGLEFDVERALEQWIATYRAILDEHAYRGDWLFVHYDQVLAGDGLERLGEFLHASVDAGFPDGKLRREPPQLDVPEQAIEIYRELCRRAGYTETAHTGVERPRVTAIVPIERGEERFAAASVQSALAQRGVRVEAIVLDRSEKGIEVAGARTVRSTSLSFGADLAGVLASVDTEYVAFELPRASSLPSRYAHALERLERGVDVATCDYALCDEHGQFVQRSSPAAMGDTPGPLWIGGLVARRSALAEVPRTAFHPVLLAWWRTLVHARRAGHVVELGFSAQRTDHDAAWERSRQDARLVTLASEAFAGERPDLTVSICTFDRRHVLSECLEAFCRQEVAPGTFEIVLVDDGSSDGTDAMLDGLEFPVPITALRRENGGLSAARNTGLEVARGEYVLFVNDDTIPFADCVAEHIAAHRAASLVGREGIAVLGTFEQPKPALANALMRTLEGADLMFAYTELRAGEFYDCFKFWTCNVSAPLDLVRRAGCFDPSFRHYGCEDADLGARLEELGMQVLYHPRARAHHHHSMDFAYLSRRARVVAQAYVRLVRKHPHLLDRWGNKFVDLDYISGEVRGGAREARRLEAAVAELSQLDLTVLERLGTSQTETARLVVERLRDLCERCNTHWWFEGYELGLREHGLDGFSELTADGDEPWPIQSASPRRLLAWPNYDSDAALDRLFTSFAPAAGFASLVLRYDAERDGPRQDVIASLEAAFARNFERSDGIDVVLEESVMDRARRLRFGRSVDALLPVGEESPEFLAEVAVEHLASAEDVAAWRRRFESGTSTAACPSRPLVPDVSVIVPTRDRISELRHLVAQLGRQDMDPLRFEVLIVDDGSHEPICAADLAPPPHLALRVLRQDGAGPAAARNLGIANARGEVMVFLNDDAVPAPDLVTRHFRAQQESRLPRAVVGRFNLLREHRTDSLAEYTETTSTLFAQPLMQGGVHYHGLALCTGNVSLRRSDLIEVGGFDAGYPHPGGEDSEVGVRLERALGLRVVYDDAIRCGHDHAISVRALARRKRAVGWSIHRLQSRHGDLGLVPGHAWPLDASAWNEIEREVRSGAAEVEAKLAGIERVCASERERGVGPITLEKLLGHLQYVERLELLHGALLAERGLAPSATLESADQSLRAA